MGVPLMDNNTFAWFAIVIIGAIFAGLILVAVLSL